MADREHGTRGQGSNTERLEDRLARAKSTLKEAKSNHSRAVKRLRALEKDDKALGLTLLNAEADVTRASEEKRMLSNQFCDLESRYEEILQSTEADPRVYGLRELGNSIDQTQCRLNEARANLDRAKAHLRDVQDHVDKHRSSQRSAEEDVNHALEDVRNWTKWYYELENQKEEAKAHAHDQDKANKHLLKPDEDNDKHRHIPRSAEIKVGRALENLRKVTKQYYELRSQDEEAKEKSQAEIDKGQDHRQSKSSTAQSDYDSLESYYYRPLSPPPDCPTFEQDCQDYTSTSKDTGLLDYASLLAAYTRQRRSPSPKHSHEESRARKRSLESKHAVGNQQHQPYVDLDAPSTDDRDTRKVEFGSQRRSLDGDCSMAKRRHSPARRDRRQSLYGHEDIRSSERDTYPSRKRSLDRDWDLVRRRDSPPRGNIDAPTTSMDNHKEPYSSQQRSSDRLHGSRMDSPPPRPAYPSRQRSFDRERDLGRRRNSLLRADQCNIPPRNEDVHKPPYVSRQRSSDRGHHSRMDSPPRVERPQQENLSSSHDHTHKDPYPHKDPYQQRSFDRDRGLASRRYSPTRVDKAQVSHRDDHISSAPADTHKTRQRSSDMEHGSRKDSPPRNSASISQQRSLDKDHDVTGRNNSPSRVDRPWFLHKFENPTLPNKDRQKDSYPSRKRSLDRDSPQRVDKPNRDVPSSQQRSSDRGHGSRIDSPPSAKRPRFLHRHENDASTRADPQVTSYHSQRRAFDRDHDFISLRNSPQRDNRNIPHRRRSYDTDRDLSGNKDNPPNVDQSHSDSHKPLSSSQHKKSVGQEFGLSSTGDHKVSPEGYEDLQQSAVSDQHQLINEESSSMGNWTEVPDSNDIIDENEAKRRLMREELKTLKKKFSTASAEEKKEIAKRTKDLRNELRTNEDKEGNKDGELAHAPQPEVACDPQLPASNQQPQTDSFSLIDKPEIPISHDGVDKNEVNFRHLISVELETLERALSMSGAEKIIAMRIKKLRDELSTDGPDGITEGCNESHCTQPSVEAQIPGRHDDVEENEIQRRLIRVELETLEKTLSMSGAETMIANRIQKLRDQLRKYEPAGDTEFGEEPLAAGQPPHFGNGEGISVDKPQIADGNEVIDENEAKRRMIREELKTLKKRFSTASAEEKNKIAQRTKELRNHLRSNEVNEDNKDSEEPPPDPQPSICNQQPEPTNEDSVSEVETQLIPDTHDDVIDNETKRSLIREEMKTLKKKFPKAGAEEKKELAKRTKELRDKLRSLRMAGEVDDHQPQAMDMDTSMEENSTMTQVTEDHQPKAMDIDISEEEEEKNTANIEVFDSTQPAANTISTNFESNGLFPVPSLLYPSHQRMPFVRGADLACSVPWLDQTQNPHNRQGVSSVDKDTQEHSSSSYQSFLNGLVRGPDLASTLDIPNTTVVDEQQNPNCIQDAPSTQAHTQEPSISSEQPNPAGQECIKKVKGVMDDEVNRRLMREELKKIKKKMFEASAEEKEALKRRTKEIRNELRALNAPDEENKAASNVPADQQPTAETTAASNENQHNQNAALPTFAELQNYSHQEFVRGVGWVNKPNVPTQSLLGKPPSLMGEPPSSFQSAPPTEPDSVPYNYYTLPSGRGLGLGYRKSFIKYGKDMPRNLPPKLLSKVVSKHGYTFGIDGEYFKYEPHESFKVRLIKQESAVLRQRFKEASQEQRAVIDKRLYQLRVEKRALQGTVEEMDKAEEKSTCSHDDTDAKHVEYPEDITHLGYAMPVEVTVGNRKYRIKKYQSAMKKWKEHQRWLKQQELEKTERLIKLSKLRDASTQTYPEDFMHHSERNVIHDPVPQLYICLAVCLFLLTFHRGQLP